MNGTNIMAIQLDVGHRLNGLMNCVEKPIERLAEYSLFTLDVRGMVCIVNAVKGYYRQ